MKNLHNTHPLVHYSILAFIYVVAIATLATHTVYHALAHGAEHHHEASEIVAQPCSSTHHETVQLTISNNKITPSQLTAQRCDTLRITSQDGVAHMPAFGPHDHHIEYPGFEEETLTNGQSNQFVLSAAGTFAVHDHYNDTISATLTVK